MPVGFEVGSTSLISYKTSEEILLILNSESFRSRGYWDYKKLDERVAAFFAGKGDNSFFIWQCLNLEIWFKQFIN